LQDYELNFTEPWFLGKRLSFDVDLFHRQNYYNALHGDYNTTSDGGTLSLTKALGSQFLRAPSATRWKTSIWRSPPASRPYPTTKLFRHRRPHYETETYNGPQASRPTFGRARQLLHLQIGPLAGIRHAQQLPPAQCRTGYGHLGRSGHAAGRHGILQAGIAHGWFFKGFATNQVLELNGRGAWFRPGAKRRTSPSSNAGFGRHVFVARLQVRNRRPLDYLGEALGGDTYWFASAEYSIPLISIIRYAFFYDIGNVYARPFSFNPQAPGSSSSTTTWAWASSSFLPIGGGTPLRLDYGVPIVHDRPRASLAGSNSASASRARFNRTI
jgi:outer membrane protein insertion porin family